MQDGVIKGTGNSRYLKSVADLMERYPTYEAFAQALMSGTLPFDFNGINPQGWTQIGTPFNKGTLLNDATAEKLGLTDNPTVNDALNQVVETTGAFELMAYSIPTSQRNPKSLYGRILQNYGGSN